MTDNAYTRRYLTDPPKQPTKTTKKTVVKQKPKETADKSVDNVDKEES